MKMNVRLVSIVTVFLLATFTASQQHLSATETIIIAHHKTGTVLSWEVVANLCCPSMNIFYNASSKEDFYPLYRLHCAPRCEEKRVLFYSNGAPKRLLLKRNKASRGVDRRLLHFSRAPVQLLVSGYLYHKRCPEAWTKRSRLEREKNRIPADVASLLHASNSQNYCDFLSKASEEDGMHAEVARSVHAQDGVSRMISDFLRLRPLKPLTVCLDDLFGDEEEEATPSWLAVLAFLGLRRDEVRHFPAAVIGQHATRSGNAEARAARTRLSAIAARSLAQFTSNHSSSSHYDRAGVYAHNNTPVALLPLLEMPPDFPCRR